jgi:hypothetical protein
LPAPTLSRGDAATIMRAKKGRDVEPSKAIRLAFEAFGLDPENQTHWDILLGTLASARPKKRRGRPPRWTEAEVAKFNNLVAWARELPARLAFRKERLEERLVKLPSGPGGSAPGASLTGAPAREARLAALDASCANLVELLESIRSRHQLPARIAVVKGVLAELIKNAETLAGPPEILLVIMRFVIEELTKDTTVFELRAAGRRRPLRSRSPRFCKK